MTRATIALLALLALLACAVGSGCADGDASDAPAVDASGPAVECTERFPLNGERCNTTTTAPNAYCRARSCNTGCEDECFCRGNGRWECLLYCRDELGCGTTPLCGVNCTDAAVGTDTPSTDTASSDTFAAD